jgi:hypothetical protein
VYAVGRVLGFLRHGVSVDACQEDVETVAVLRKLSVLTQAPPGARLGDLRESVACGRPVSWGSLDREVTYAGPSGDASAFYAKLAAADGWQTDHGGGGIYAAYKPDGHRCRWNLAVRSTADGVYHVQVSYLPRDLAAACT